MIGHSRYKEFLAWAREGDVPPIDEWWDIFLHGIYDDDDVDEEEVAPVAVKAEAKRQRGRTQIECSRGCGATFRSAYEADAHEAVPHDECPWCGRWYRCLAMHYELAKRRRHDKKSKKCWLGARP